MPTIEIAGVDRSTGYTPGELANIQVRQIAWDGEVGTGQLPIPDSDGTYEVYAGQSALIKDAAETIIDGFVGATQRDRGEGAAPPRRLVSHTLGDENGLLYGFRAYRWERPAETTRQRFLAFLAEFVPEVTDTTWVLATNVANLKKKSYTTEDLFSELRQEIADLTGNTAFIEARRAHLHRATEGAIGGLAVSDVAWDQSTTFFPMSPSREKDPSDLGNDVLVKSASGTSRATDATSITRHDSGGIKHQRLVDIGEGTAAVRAAKAAEILAESKAERITYECDIGPLTPAQVNMIPPGCLMAVTSQVMGLTASTQRLAARTLTYMHPGRWMAHLEFGYPVRIRQKPPRVGPQPPFVPESGCTGGLYPITTSRSFVPLNTPGTSDAEGLVYYGAGVPLFAPNPGAASVWGFPEYGTGGADFAGDCTNSGLYFVLVGAGNLTVQTVAYAGGSLRGMSWSVFHNTPTGIVECQGPNAIATGVSVAITIPTHADAENCVHTVVLSDGGGPCGSKWGWSGAVWTSTPTAINAPDVGQPVGWEGAPCGVGVGLAFQTNYPYQPGSLRVSVGGIEVQATETDPDQGQYTLPLEPTTCPHLVRYSAADGTPTAAGNDPAPPATPPTLPPGIGPAHAHGASEITVLDTGGNFVGTDVETVLAELATAPTVAALDDLTDVVITTAVTGDRLRFNGTNWVNTTLIWKPVMDGLGNVVTDGTGAAIMTEVTP